MIALLLGQEARHTAEMSAVAGVGRIGMPLHPSLYPSLTNQRNQPNANLTVPTDVLVTASNTHMY